MNDRPAPQEPPDAPDHDALSAVPQDDPDAASSDDLGAASQGVLGGAPRDDLGTASSDDLSGAGPDDLGAAPQDDQGAALRDDLGTASQGDLSGASQDDLGGVRPDGLGAARRGSLGGVGRDDLGPARWDEPGAARPADLGGAPRDDLGTESPADQGTAPRDELTGASQGGLGGASQGGLDGASSADLGVARQGGPGVGRDDLGAARRDDQGGARRDDSGRVRRDDLDGGLRQETLSSFPAFYGYWMPRLTGYLRSQTSDGRWVEDVAQEAMLAARRHWDDLLTYDKPGAWLFMVATKMLRRWLAKAREQCTSLDDMLTRGDGGPASLASAEDPNVSGHGGTDDRLDLMNAIRSLPRRQREALALHDLLGFPHAEVGEILGFSEGSAKTHVHRARKRLEELLRAPGPPPVIKIGRV
ncbi:sigma-70 family RNA polymerase sigma factor [Actinomadura barringtoniae]|uniref:Sigma-70 family RNA polymerase sigma factor n=1 Tax=Actinomadura barringtoniae TaxID=1427535 RepID=A0A939P5P6_9ACTN|nr:sigma-70 family RNA polymerase sigma factor [Actinomadura barringtoniae]MBO2445781.1 sigma-70 family RNA polymerase sigma factor [Actinomadura barringtoniae]